MTFRVVLRDGCEKPPRRHHVIRFDKFDHDGDNTWTYCQNWRDKTDLAFGQFHIYQDSAAAENAFNSMCERDGVDYTVRLLSVRALTRRGAVKAIKKMLLGKSASRITQVKTHRNQGQSGSADPAHRAASSLEHEVGKAGLSMNDIDRMLGPVGEARQLVMNFMGVCQGPTEGIGDGDPERKLFLTTLFALGVTDYVGRQMKLDGQDMFDVASISLTMLGNDENGVHAAMNASDAAEPESRVANTVKAGFFAANKMFAKEDPTATFALFEVISTDFGL